MFTTVPCYTETYAILIRKANEGRLTAVALRSCLGALKHDVLAAEDFELISVGDETFLESVVHIAAHNLNSADAAFLAACLPVAAEVARSGDRPLCVTSDQRLIRAAAAQGPTSLNPEAVLPSGLAAFLNPFL
jgi:predicted nucleic acid-binding protein